MIFSHSGNHFQPPGMPAVVCRMLANHRKLAKPTRSIAPVQTVWHYSRPVTFFYNPLSFPRPSERIGEDGPGMPRRVNFMAVRRIHLRNRRKCLQPNVTLNISIRPRRDFLVATSDSSSGDPPPPVRMPISEQK